MEIKKVANKDFIYKVQEKETIKDICLKFKILENNLVRENNLTNKSLQAGDLLYISCENNLLHIVKPLETLQSIARKYNVSSEYIVKKNNLQNKNLFIGQKLVL